MKTKSIKQIVIVVAIILAICAVFALLFFGMSQLLHIDRGQVVAEYDGNLVYESDVQDIINYNLMVGVTENTTEQDLHEIMVNAVETYVKYKVMEIDLAEKGYEINEKDLKETLEESKQQLEKAFGYKKWCEMYRVSKDILEEDIRRYYLADVYYEYAKTYVEVTEEEAKDYYAKHALTEYADPAGYTWTSLLCPVKNFADASEMAAAIAEAEAYIEKLQNKEITFDEVKKELANKYTLDKGYTSMQFSGEDFTSMNDMVTISDEKALEDLIAQLNNVYENRDLNADPDSEAYSNYMHYVSNVFKANTFYALQHSEIGEIWDKPLESYAGYYIVRLDSISLKNDFVPFEDVKNDIITTLLAEKLEATLIEYFDELEEEFNVHYYVS